MMNDKSAVPGPKDGFIRYNQQWNSAKTSIYHCGTHCDFGSIPGVRGLPLFSVFSHFLLVGVLGKWRLWMNLQNHPTLYVKIHDGYHTFCQWKRRVRDNSKIMRKFLRRRCAFSRIFRAGDMRVSNANTARTKACYFWPHCALFHKSEPIALYLLWCIVYCAIFV
jgi:hypothetical protein